MSGRDPNGVWHRLTEGLDTGAATGPGRPARVLCGLPGRPARRGDVGRVDVCVNTRAFSKYPWPDLRVILADLPA